MSDEPTDQTALPQGVPSDAATPPPEPAVPPLDPPAPPPAAAPPPVDLSALTKASAADAGLPAVLTPEPPSGTDDAGARTANGVQPFSMDETRQMIALLLLGALLCIVVVEMLFAGFFGVNCWLFGLCSNRASQAAAIINTTIQPMFTAMIGLVGSVVGFYFGSKNTTG